MENPDSSTPPEFDEIPRQWIEHSRLLLDSFRHWLNRELVDRDGTISEQAERLYRCSTIVVSHGTEADPVLNYANHAALSLWEIDCETLVRTPSRKTAEPVHRDERRQLLERTTRDGYVDDYRGIRISQSRRRFLIENAIVWNLIDAGGSYRGQAAMFHDWRYLAEIEQSV